MSCKENRSFMERAFLSLTLCADGTYFHDVRWALNYIIYCMTLHHFWYLIWF